METLKVQFRFQLRFDQLLGYAGNFLNAQKFYHIELFFTEEALLNDLTAEPPAYDYSVYKLKEIDSGMFYKVEEGGLPKKEDFDGYLYAGRHIKDAEKEEQKYKEIKDKKGTAYYIKADAFNDTEKVEKINLLQLTQFFKKYEDTDIYCTTEEKAALGNLTDTEGEQYMSKFPMEWNKEFYQLCGEGANCFKCEKGGPYSDRCGYSPNEMFRQGLNPFYAMCFAEVMKNADVWNETLDVLSPVKGKNLPSGKDAPPIWHFHPLYFLEYLKNFDLSFNPYLGIIKGKEMGLVSDGYADIEIRDNPGFSTAKETTEGDVRFKYRDNENPKLFWAKINVPPNQRYEPGNPKSQNHTGVDFAGEPGVKVYSLIYGEVWACTYNKSIKENDRPDGGLGICMAIKSRDEDILYILGHLTDYLVEPGAKVEPRMPVALVGTTGNSTGHHLHVDARICRYKKRKDVFDENANQSFHLIKDKYKNGGSLIDSDIKKGLIYNPKIDKNRNKELQRVNPFNHGEKIP